MSISMDESTVISSLDSTKEMAEESPEVHDASSKESLGENQSEQAPSRPRRTRTKTPRTVKRGPSARKQLMQAEPVEDDTESASSNQEPACEHPASVSGEAQTASVEIRPPSTPRKTSADVIWGTRKALTPSDDSQATEVISSAPARANRRASRLAEPGRAETASPRRAVGRKNSVSSGLQKPQQELTLKVLVVGNAKCGKTSIIQRYANGVFSEQYNTTIGADFIRKKVQVDDSTGVKLQLWDIAGQDRFAKLTRAYFNKARGAVVVCDITREGTFESVQEWKAEIDQSVKYADKPIPTILIVNKVDLLPDPVEALKIGAKLQATVDKCKFAGWFLTSAKEDHNIEPAMNELIRKMVDIQREVDAPTAAPVEAQRSEAPLVNPRDDGIIRLGDPRVRAPPPQQQSGCC